MLNDYNDTLTSVTQNFNQILWNDNIVNLKEKDIFQESKKQIDNEIDLNKLPEIKIKNGTSISIKYLVNKIIPNLKKEFKKGDNGKVAIIGGSKEYMGAPFSSSKVSIKAGSDSAVIFTYSKKQNNFIMLSPEGDNSSKDEFIDNDKSEENIYNLNIKNNYENSDENKEKSTEKNENLNEKKKKKIDKLPIKKEKQKVKKNLVL